MNLYKVHDNEFILQIDSKHVTGDRAHIIKAMLLLDILPIDIEQSIMSLETNGHHVAHFGIYKSFISSKKIGDLK